MIMTNVKLGDSVQKLGFPSGVISELKRIGVNTVKDLVDKDTDGLLDDSFTLKNYLSRFFVIDVRGNDKEKKKTEETISFKGFSFQRNLQQFIKEHYAKQIEIRYKTNRVKSDKRWRRVVVAGQNEDLLFTNDVRQSGGRVAYVKEKIVEFREADS